MTPPDSDWGLFKSMTPEQVADAKAAETDSDAREVRHAFAPHDGPVCVVCGLCRDEHRNPSVSLPLSLAQRILAALEEQIRKSTRSEPELHAVRAELRAVIGK